MDDQRKVKLVDQHLVWQSAESLQIRTEGKSIVLKGTVVRTAVLKVLALLDGSYNESEINAEIAEMGNADQCRKVLNALSERSMIEKIDPMPAALEHYDEHKLNSLHKHFRHTIARYDNAPGNSWEPLLVMQGSCILLYGAAELVIPVALNLAAVAAGRMLVLAEPVSARDVGRSRYLTADDLGRHPAEVIAEQLKLTQNPSSVSAVGTFPASVLEWQQLLQDCSLVISACSKPIIFNATYENMNRAVLAAKVRWLPLAVVDNLEIHIGPSIIPHETACYKCYEYRFQSNVGQLDSYKAFAETVNAMQDMEDFGVLAPFAEIAANYTAVEAIRLLSPNMSPVTAGKLLTINLDDLSSERHPVLRVPRCPHCNAHAERCPERVWA